MKNISVLIEGPGKKTFKFKKPIVTYGTRLSVPRTSQVLSVTEHLVSKAHQIKL